MMKLENNCEIKIYDTTLRDGTQSKDVNLTIHDKMEIVKLLDELQVDYIELGWPGSNPKDMEVFEQAQKIKLQHAKISAFGSTRRKGITAEEDPNLNAIIKTKAKYCSIFGKTWLQHVDKQLNMKPEENLAAIYDSIKYLSQQGLTIFFDAEHYFDGFKDNPQYAVRSLCKAIDGGANCLILCDTNGGCLPDEIKKIFEQTQELMNKEGKKYSEVKYGMHMHNDSGCAVANTTIISEKINQVQGTINGFGERCGNADLCQVIPNLMLKKRHKTNINLEKIKETSEKIYILANVKENKNQPFVGTNAFSHKGGIHVDAISKGAIYEHIKPELVGNKQFIILSDLSGSANIVEVVKKFGFKVDKKNPVVQDMLEEIKELEKKGYNIGNTEAEQYLLTQKYFGKQQNRLNITDWKLVAEKRDNKEHSEGVIVGTIEKEQHSVIERAEGGPVGVTFLAMKKLVAIKHKEIENVKLVNFKVMIAEDKGAESLVRVYIEFANDKNEWATIGVSENILEASMEAIEKGFRYYLLKNC